MTSSSSTPVSENSGARIMAGLKDALEGNFTRVEMGDKAFVRVKRGTRHAGNWQAWAIGKVNKRGQFHARKIVWGRLMARAERREGEVIRHATILVGAD